LSKFDARWITSMTWNRVDQATLTLQQSFTNGDQAAFNTTLAKPLPTGGVAGITFNVNYLNLAEPPLDPRFVALATSYTPRVQFVFEQPLLQAFGVEINQLLPQHPGSALIPGLRPSGGQTTEGILITRIRYEQQRAEFDRQINNMLLNVETAYWNLYAAYYNLYAQEDVLRQAFDLYSILEVRYKAGTVRKQDVDQTAAQYMRFRRQVIVARQQVLESERNLRGLLGGRSDNAPDRLVPVDEPTLAPFIPDFYEVANEALAYRPELILARHDLKFRQLDLILQKNLRRPDLRFFSSYDINGLGSRLDGPRERVQIDPITGQTTTTPVNSLASLTANQFNSWQLGLRLDIPLGFRDANAAVRQGQLNLIRSYYQLQDSERKILEVATQQYRNVIFQYDQIKYARAEREWLQSTLRLNQTLIEGGQWDVNSLFNILQVQQQLAAAIATEFQAIGQYNAALAALEWAQGTIQRYNNVVIGEGPLPAYVADKAADHFKARESAIKLRERSVAEYVMPDFNRQLWDKAFPQGGQPGGLPTLPVGPVTAPAPSSAEEEERERLPTPKPLSPTGPITVQPGVQPPMPVSPWPAATTTTSIPADAIIPTFTPTGTVNLPSRGLSKSPETDPGPGSPVSVNPPPNDR
jgi:outer membrane protein TolC